jgi:hypothetical protein
MAAAAMMDGGELVLLLLDAKAHVNTAVRQGTDEADKREPTGHCWIRLRCITGAERRCR